MINMPGQIWFSNNSILFGLIWKYMYIKIILVKQIHFFYNAPSTCSGNMIFYMLCLYFTVVASLDLTLVIIVICFQTLCYLYNSFRSSLVYVAKTTYDSFFLNLRLIIPGFWSDPQINSTMAFLKLLASLVLVLTLRTFSHLAKLVFFPLFYFANFIRMICTLLNSMFDFPTVWFCSATLCR